MNKGALLPRSLSGAHWTVIQRIYYCNMSLEWNDNVIYRINTITLESKTT